MDSVGKISMNQSNKKEPLVSIIMPCFNSINTIDESINSVLNQDYNNYELIIADDNSSDGTYEHILELYSDCSNIKILKNKFQKGVSGARNSALAMANGRFVCFLDSDDIWLPFKLTKQIDFMLTNNHVLCFSNYIVFKDINGSRKYKSLFFKEKVSYCEMLKTCSFGCLTVCYDVSYFGKCFFENVVKEDYVCWLSLLKRTPYAYNQGDELALYRQQKKSLSSNKLKEIKKQYYVNTKIEGNNVFFAIFDIIIYIYNGLVKRV
ncbi:TPA: glycosyltransferase family 2 protein [Citrobacter braakii]|nr:glycosyltransferase family 2 protein [Citrobacter braakii]